MARVGHSLERVSHRNGRSGALTGALCLLFAIEGMALHIFLYPRYPVFSILLALLNIATLAWVLVDFLALGTTTSSLDADNLHLRIGRRVDAQIPVAQVAQATLLSWRDVSSPSADYLNATRPVEPNVLITFQEPVAVRLFGRIERRIGSLGMVVDDPEGFVSALLADASACE